jgi:hypothetical protein
VLTGSVLIDVIHWNFRKNFLGVPSSASKSTAEIVKDRRLGGIIVRIFKYWFRMMFLGYLNMVQNCVNYQMNKDKADDSANAVNYELSKRTLAYIWGESLFSHTRICDPSLLNLVQTPCSAKSSVFCDITPCSLLKVNRRVGGTCHFLVLLFDLEDEDSVFLRNVSWPSTDNRALYPRR